MVPIDEKDGRAKQTILGDIAVLLTPDDPGVAKDDEDVVFGCEAMLEIVLYLLEVIILIFTLAQVQKTKYQ